MNIQGDVQMRFLAKELRKDYEYHIKQCPDVQEIDEQCINVSDVLQAYYILADYFTDESANAEIEKMLVGVKDYNLLVSSICRQSVTFAGKVKYTDKVDICATLFYGIVKNHSLVDGNKRTALLILLYQLSTYGYYPKQEVTKFENLVVSVAENSLPDKYHSVYKKFQKQDDAEIKTISYVLKRLTERKDRKYHLDLSMRDFCEALKSRGVEYRLENSKIKFTRTYKKRLIPKTDYYFINFYGWTRAVEAKMARDTLNALGLLEEYTSISNIFNGKPSFYKLINQFEIPLRRLKDE